MYYTKFYKYLSEFLTTTEVPFEAFAKMVVKYDDDRNRVLKARHFAVHGRPPMFAPRTTRPTQGVFGDSLRSLHNIHWRPQFYICDVCRLNYDLIFHSEDDLDSKNSIIDQLDLGIKLLSRDEYYQVCTSC